MEILMEMGAKTGNGMGVKMEIGIGMGIDPKLGHL